MDNNKCELSEEMPLILDSTIQLLRHEAEGLIRRREDLLYIINVLTLFKSRFDEKTKAIPGRSS